MSNENKKNNHSLKENHSVRSNKKKRKRKRKIFGGIFLSLGVLFVVSLIMTGILLEPSVRIGSFANYDANNMIATSQIVSIINKDDNGIEINSFYGENKIFIPIETLQQHTLDAFISIEDKRFYSHKGLDYRRIFGAAKNNVFKGGKKEGGSTITQQLVKNTHLSNEKTFKRKIQEARIAKKIERSHTKEEILEQYLNILYFGNNIYGIGCASEIMFGINPSKLSIAQSALLAGIINSPLNYSPYHNIGNAKARRDLVLLQMFNQNKITEDEYSRAMSEKILIMSDIINKNHYNSAVLFESCEILGCSHKELFKKGVTIETHSNVGLSNKLDNVLASFCSNQKNINAYAIALCPSTGAILYTGGKSNYNLHNMKRQPGSTLKPIISYAPAIEKKMAFPATPILDKKTDFGNYSPSNYRDKYDGWTNVENALANSSNVVSIKLLQSTGIEYSKSFARKCGIKFDKEDNALPLALGAMHNGITLKELANSYTPLANDGKFIKASCIGAIYDNKGKLLYKQKNTETRAMSDTTSYFVTQMLQKCAIEGTAKNLSTCNAKSQVAAKTGTVGNANGNTDAYCIAYTPDYLVAVWLGSKDNNALIKSSGGGTPTLIAKEMLEILCQTNTTQKNFNIPHGIKKVNIDLSEYSNKHRLVEACRTTKARYTKTIELPTNYPLYSLDKEEKNNNLTHFNNKQKSMTGNYRTSKIAPQIKKQLESKQNIKSQHKQNLKKTKIAS